METYDVDLIKDKYKKLKIENYSKEEDLKTLIKAKEKFPGFSKDEKWLERYKILFNDIAEEMQCFKQLKTVLSEDELAEFSYEVKAEIFKKIYYCIQRIHKERN